MSTIDARIARGSATRARILSATRSELARHGQDLTLDHVAARLAITKQAVLYHFSSKDRLFVELAVLGLASEADAMVAAVAPARSGGDAVRRFMRANVAFHIGDLERFRLMYVRAQVVRGAKDTLSADERARRIYPVTSRMYAALEQKLRGDRAFPRHLDARTLAVSVHLASIGFATIAGELEGAKDTMKLSFDRYVDELAAVIERGLGSRRKRP